ncbi:hypothetical protein F4677DRAFT_259063 [Hypoxylon crocopeplum]|nr:hypothetical protein F4677DRAFT_259063 [Hypoxylon crocopeplum]
MTSAESLVYYPAYCFHLSSTINKWCPLRATDIHHLESRPGFEGDNVFFSLNHPIRWVRVVGVVVAIDEYYGRRVYTVDDSTGECIECCLDIPKPVDSRHKNEVGGEAATATATATAITAPPPDAHSDIDVGMVVEVKGSTTIFRDQKQIKVQKLQRMKSSNQEVQFWNKICDFRRDVLSRPWVLGKKEVRRCKKYHMADVDTEEKKKERKKSNGHALRSKVQSGHTKTKSKDTTSKPTKQEPLIHPEASNSYAEGQYDALGL